MQYFFFFFKGVETMSIYHEIFRTLLFHGEQLTFLQNVNILEEAKVNKIFKFY